MSEEKLSRREALSAFGLGGLALAAGPAALSATLPRDSRVRRPPVVADGAEGTSGAAGSQAGRTSAGGTSTGEGAVGAPERFSAGGLPPAPARRYGAVADMQADSSLREGLFAEVLGYYTPGDGGAAAYRIRKTSGGEEIGVPLKNGLLAVLTGVTSVNYKQFGAVGDGENDDGRQILLAHRYANENRLPVVNGSGEYWIKDTRSIPVMGNVSWGQTIFHIDEQYNTKKESRFEVLSREPSRPIELSPQARAAFLSKLKPGVKIISELAGYKNCLVTVADEGDQIGVRAGREGQSWDREELFYVEEHGRIIGDIAWEFKDYTSLTAFPCSDSYLVVEGGTFYVSGDNPGETYNGYWRGGISVTRSRTIIRDQWVGLEKGKKDISLTPRSGFYSLSNVYDVTLENIRLIPWEQNREGEARDVGAGTYGITGRRILNALFRRITAEGSPVHWGVFGTNLNKDFRIEQCVLNRVDVHFHCWNLYIKDSAIGYKGITVTGGGDLHIENTTCWSRGFINFRRDYGAKWDGHIRIRNCRFLPSSKGSTYLLNFNPVDFDYKYPIGFARTILMEDVIVDYSTLPGCEDPCWLMNTPDFSRVTDGPRLFFPRRMTFRNILVEGREQGLRLLEIRDAGGYDTGVRGGYDEVRLTPNSFMEFERIQLEKIAPGKFPGSAHLLMDVAEEGYEDAFSLYPSIRIAGSNELMAVFGDIAAALRIDDCSVARLTAGRQETLKGSVAFNECLFLPEAGGDDNDNFFMLASVLGTRFTNCTVHAPRIAGVSRPEETGRTGFLELNKSVRYNHLNTTLGKDILTYCRKEGIELKPAFIAMLKSHHELEPEDL